MIKSNEESASASLLAFLLLLTSLLYHLLPYLFLCFIAWRECTYHNDAFEKSHVFCSTLFCFFTNTFLCMVHTIAPIIEM